jgi:mono/diheme cytochrome c family protein
VPQFASEPPDKPDWQVFWILKNGVRYSGMGAWNGEISAEKIWQVVTFLSQLRNLPPDIQSGVDSPANAGDAGNLISTPSAYNESSEQAFK